MHFAVSLVQYFLMVFSCPHLTSVARVLLLSLLGGISYRALLPHVDNHNKAFNRLLTNNCNSPQRKKKKKKVKSSPTDGPISGSDDSSSGDDDDDDDEIDTVSTSSSGSNVYLPGFLDDPQMVQGRHRHVMIGEN